MLQCTVRNCRSPLVRKERQVTCEHHHSFDLARSGYVNVLQPQDKRSKNPGDTASAVAARRRIHDRGVTAPLLDAIAALLHGTADDVVLDAGCGDGFYLGSLAARTGLDPHGIDISIPAIDAAAKRYQGYEWVVANADRIVPYSDAAFSAVLSITGRMNPREFHRVLRPGGRLLVALAAPEDLIELRGSGRDRVERTVADFATGFPFIEQRRITTHADLDAAGVEDILQSIYRPIQATPARPARVTFSLDLLLFHRE
jgi:23S rRNA (guanine745-N1)-methyltransferase